MQKKLCGMCKTEKTIDNFSPEKATPTGLKWACRDCEKIRRRKSYLKYRERRITASNTWAKNNMSRVLEWHKKRRRELKIKIVTVYGGKCSCCGEHRIEFLTLEHINKDGKAHRKQCHTSQGTYVDVIRNSYPKHYTVLCCNCNYAERYGKKCPHKLEKENI